MSNKALLEKGDGKSLLGVSSRSGVQEGIIAPEVRLGGGSSFNRKTFRKIQLPWRKSAGERGILQELGRGAEGAGLVQPGEEKAERGP